MDILDFDLATNVYPVSTISTQSHNSQRYEVNTYQMQADVSIQTFNLINGLILTGKTMQNAMSGHQQWYNGNMKDHTILALEPLSYCLIH